jgi:dipeptidyl aminopeptidase/acylaminoacyl peptidase
MNGRQSCSRIVHLFFALLFVQIFLSLGILAQERRPITLDDMGAIREVDEPQISPAGDWVAYTVGTIDWDEDEEITHLWMSSWDGKRSVPLTFGKHSESHPRWSPDGKWLAFLSSREEDDDIDQVWMLNHDGGEAQRLTDFKGSITEFEWSPDGKRLAIIARDEDLAKTNKDKSKEKDKPKNPKPRIIDRYYFKEDKSGYLGELRSHLYLFDVDGRSAELLTAKGFGETQPQWSPDGTRISFVSKQGTDGDRNRNYDLFVIDAKPSATARRVSPEQGVASEPEAQGPPRWSPDGKYIAYVQATDPKLLDYGAHHLAVIPSEGGEVRVLGGALDRNINKPVWSSDGNAIYALLEDDRTDSIQRIPLNGARGDSRTAKEGPLEPVTVGRREVTSFDISKDGHFIALVSTPDTPAEVFAVEKQNLRPLSAQNQELFSRLKLATTREISFPSKDGTTVNGFMVLPPDYHAGTKYPTLLRIHGGPVSQFNNEFDFEWQYFAAQGYVVVAANPRGSSGRGTAYSKAIFADWGNVDVQDVLGAVDYAVAQGIADPQRLGVGGWSYGGMLTNYTIASDTRFKAATSGAGISDILAGYGTDQYVRDYELELGYPWQNSEGWMKVSYPFFHADRIVTPTLFLCGDKDFNVPLQNSEQLYQALRSLGRDTKLIIYPGQFHKFTVPSYQQDRLLRYIEWYGKYLMPKKAN